MSGFGAALCAGWDGVEIIRRAAALQGDRLEGREEQGVYSSRLQGLVKVIEAQGGMVVMVPGPVQLLFIDIAMPSPRRL